MIGGAHCAEPVRDFLERPRFFHPLFGFWTIGAPCCRYAASSAITAVAVFEIGMW